MSTRCIIAKKSPAGGYDAIYCQHDGEPGYVGKLLVENYGASSANVTRLDLLFQIGFLDELGATIEGCVPLAPAPWINPAYLYCPDLDAVYHMGAGGMACAYNYIFDGVQWMYYDALLHEFGQPYDLQPVPGQYWEGVTV